MFIENDLRVRMARQLYASKYWPGWDKRGEVLIRYGPPDYRGIVPAEVTARKVHPPGELWFYRRQQMIVSFQDYNLNGNYIFAINPFGAAQDMSPDLVEFLLYDTGNSLQESIPSNLLSFYREAQTDPDAEIDWGPLQEALHGVQKKKYLRTRMRGLHEGMDEVIDPDYEKNLPDNPSLVFQQEKSEELANNFEATLEENPVAYPFNFEQKRFPFFFGIDQFRGGEDLNRVDVNIEFAADLAAGADTLASKTYRTSAVFFDADYKEIARDGDEIEIPTVRLSEDDEEDAAVRLMPAQLFFTLAKDYYRVAVAVEEVESHRRTSYRTNLPFENFEGRLAISDILFASKIEPAERMSPFTRGALEVIPHPLRSYRKEAPVPVYFEVYNLGVGDDGTSSYAVEYRIVPHSSNKTGFWDRFRGEGAAVSSRFQSSSYGANDALHVSVGTENLHKGTYDFLVTVTDEVSHEVAYRKATFSIVE
jgi:hypothetical protein